MKFDFRKIDQFIAKQMHVFGVSFLRLAFAIIYFWFGILKPLGVSPAESLLKATVAWLPFWSPDTWLYVIGYWEITIGVLFLFKKTTRIAIALLFLQLLGTFMPLFFLPEVVYQNGKSFYLLTMEGQYIIKNLMIISAGLVVWGSVYKFDTNNQA